MSKRIRITVRATPEQVAAIDAAAKKLGLDRNSYLLLRATAGAADDAIVDGISSAMDVMREELAGALAADLDAHTERVIGNLKKIASWMQHHAGPADA
jgi:uncharacterized protein (DUF1778 family)